MALKKFFNGLVLILLTIASAVVFAASFFTTIYYDAHVDVDFPHYKKESILHLVISMALVFIFFFIANKKKWLESGKLIVLALLFCTVYSLTLIVNIKPLPVDDSSLLDDALRQFSEGDYSSLKGAGGYLYTWPFQLGYFLFMQLMDFCFGHGNYYPWDIALLICILVTVFLLYKITWELFEDKRICGIMALLSFGLLCFYNYSTYIYGDIYSLAPQTFALYLIILFVKREKIRYCIWAAFFMAIAILLKTNSEITLIAIVIVLLLSVHKDDIGDNGYQSYEVCKRFWVRVVLIAFVVLITWLGKGFVNSHYMKLTGLSEIPGGSPSVSHIVMGLSESELEDGWYNRYNYDVFAENEYDTEKTRLAATEDLKERLRFFSQNPVYFAKFMARKFVTQWADPVCISTHNLDLVSRHVENPGVLKDFIVFGKGSIIFRWVMNVFMSVCYLCVLVYLFARLRAKWTLGTELAVQKNSPTKRTSGTELAVQKVTTQEMLLLVMILGGMAFHQFWEGSSRYAMRYYIYWLPYAAYGMNVILGKLSKLQDKNT
jgi:hypothetical protein